MILGTVCTRNCAFCGVPKGKPSPPDPDEPNRVALAIKQLGIKYAVITSVSRDDLPDKGSTLFADTIEAINKKSPRTKVEVLTPDFNGEELLVANVLRKKPLVFNHNLETVPRLYPKIRPQADYQRSLYLLKTAKEKGAVYTKSGLMLGLGEEREEVLRVLGDLRKVDCDIITIGQYLRPSQANTSVVRFASPAEFEDFRRQAFRMGFRACAAGPFVRSSYFAETLLERATNQKG